MATGARTGGEPSGAHWDHRAAARDTAGGPGRYTKTEHGAAVVTSEREQRGGSSHCCSRSGSFLLYGARAEPTVKQR